MKRLLLNLLATALLICSCQPVEQIPAFLSGSDGRRSSVKIELFPEGLEPIDTRSSFTWQDDEIKDIEIIALNAEGLIDNIIYTKGTSVKFEGIVGEQYTFYALANLGGRIGFSSADELFSHVRSISYSEIAKNGVPLCCAEAVQCTVSAKGNTVQLPMKRMLARIDFRVDTSLLKHADLDNGFTVKSVSIYNAINSYRPFEERVKQEATTGIDYSFDHANEQDLASLNSGATISLYAFENMQGELLQGNSDPWSKVPSKTDKSELCSYLELTASYSAGGLSSDDITYRMYLGANSTSNFDVRRNHIYSLTLRPSEDEIDGHRGSWKISSKDWSDSRTIRFIPEEVTIPSLGNASVSIAMTPDDFDIALQHKEWLSEAGCTFIYDSTKQQITITNTEEQEEDVSNFITAYSWDGALSADCNITVKGVAYPVSLEFDETVKELYINGPNAGNNTIWTPSVTATYSDGSTAKVTAQLRTNNSNIAKIVDNAVHSVALGSAQITAEYRERGRTVTTSTPATVNVTNPLLVLIADPNEIAMEAVKNNAYNISDNMNRKKLTVTARYPSGDTQLEWTALQWELTDTSGEDVFGLSRMGNMMLRVVLKTATKDATAELKASYTDNGITKDAIIYFNTFDDPVVRLYITPDSKTLEIGEQVYLQLVGVSSSGATTVMTSIGRWTSSSDCISLASSGQYKACKALSEGRATVTATYSGMSASAEIIVNGQDVITYETEISPKSATAKVGEEIQLNARSYKLTNGVRDNGTDVTATARWESSPSTGISISNGKASASQAGVYTVKASYQGASAEAIVEFTQADVVTNRLEITPTSSSAKLGEEIYFKAKWFTITNGVQDEGRDVTSSAAWSSDPSTGVTINRGKVTASAVGSYTITATYSGQSAEATATFTKADVISYELVVSPSSITLNEGDSKQLNATWYKLTNGVRDTGEDVTGKASWTSSADYVASVNGGKVSGLSQGNSTVTATYNGEQADCSVKVVHIASVTEELVITPDRSSVYQFGDAVSLKAIYYLLTDGERDEGTDVSSSADWTVVDGSTILNNEGKGSFSWKSSYGVASVSASYGDLNAEAEITVIGIKSIDISPNPVELEYNSQQQLSVHAKWSNDSTSTVAAALCNWAITSGKDCYTVGSDGLVKCLNVGNDGIGKVSLKSDTSIATEFQIKCTTIPELKASVSSIDTWGGNSYPVTFSFLGKTVTPTLTGVSYTASAPNGLISYSGGRLVATDWWGKSGSWITSSPSYTATFSYNGYTTTITGTMHGTTGFKDIGSMEHYFRDVMIPTTSGKATLTGCEDTVTTEDVQLQVSYAANKLSNGYLKVGSYPVTYSVTDPTNGLTRSGSTTVTIKTNVVKVEGQIIISNCDYSPSDNRTVNGSTSTNGGILATIGIHTNGHDETVFDVEMKLKYTDVYGVVRTATYPLESPDYGEVPAAKSSNGVVPGEDGDGDEHEINGFKFIIQWKADRAF